MPSSTLRSLAALLLATGGATWLADAADDRPAIPEDTLPAELPAEAPFGLPEELAERLAEDSDALVALGRGLFFDARLSRDATIACASCHRPELAFGDDRAHSVGVDGARTERNSPALLNRALGEHFMWDGSAPTLEEQVLEPISNPLEMALPLEEALARLGRDGELVRRFEAATGSAPSADGLARALAAFVRRLVSGDAPFDRFQAGEFAALNDAERAGLWVFESRGKCWRCHRGANFSDEGFHNTGVGATAEGAEAGRAEVSGRPEDRGAFKTPTLRGLVHSAPYMHDGSLASLEEVVEFYRRGGQPNPTLDPLVQPLELSDEDAANLVAFLKALTPR